MIPAPIVAAATGVPDAVAVSCREEVLGGAGAATASVTRLTGVARTAAGERPFSVVRKRCRPLTSGRHAKAAADPRHWAYWRREALAYRSGLLPPGPGLAAPRCLGVLGDDIYLTEVDGPVESPALAAMRLGVWQRATPVPRRPWLAGHQLAQRLAVTELDWAGMPGTKSMSTLWDGRHALMRELKRVPRVLSHGDFHIGNLVAAGDTTVVLDWAALGVAPVGADLAHLALSTLTDPLDAYLDGLRGRFGGAAAVGYRVTLVLTGVSRLHWMLSRGMPPPAGYAEFVRGQAG
jgi:Phosphotransferase enzyme family